MVCPDLLGGGQPFRPRALTVNIGSPSGRKSPATTGELNPFQEVKALFPETLHAPNACSGDGWLFLYGRTAACLSKYALGSVFGIFGFCCKLVHNLLEVENSGFLSRGELHEGLQPCPTKA